MTYAPVMIPTLCRAEHFVRCVESLKNNSWACYTDVYIFLDYPSKTEHWNGYNSILDYLENGDFSCFLSFQIIKREINFGVGKNNSEARKQLFRLYDSLIFAEDDVEFSPNFLEYMDRCLEISRKNENIIAVCGYSYPISWNASDGSSVRVENFFVPAWGIGFLRDRFLVMEKYLRSGGLIHDFSAAIHSGVGKKMSNAAWCDYAFNITKRYPYKSLLCSTSDVAMRIYLALFNKSVYAPILSKTRNWGFDGSGLYCQNIPLELNGIYAQDYNYSQQPIDEADFFEISLDLENAISDNLKEINKFDWRSKRNILYANFRALLYLILGEKLYHKILVIACKMMNKN